MRRIWKLPTSALICSSSTLRPRPPLPSKMLRPASLFGGAARGAGGARGIAAFEAHEALDHGRLVDHAVRHRVAAGVDAEVMVAATALDGVERRLQRGVGAAGPAADPQVQRVRRGGHAKRCRNQNYRQSAGWFPKYDAQISRHGPGRGSAEESVAGLILVKSNASSR